MTIRRFFMESNTYKGKKIEFHILQSFPVTCLNRDDVGSPKTAVVGGVTRARVSSQAWKRQVRLSLRDFGVSLGIRTKYIKEKIADACLEQGANHEEAKMCGEKISNIFIKNSEKDDKSDTLMFLSNSDFQLIASEFKANNFVPEKLIIQKDKKKQAKEFEKIIGKRNYSINALDIALFGRMVAQVPKMNIEAASSFSHAISTHKITNEIDFFTAIDDFHPEDSYQTGSAHMDSLEFNSATYYRYVSLDLGQLVETMGGDYDLVKAIGAFIKALYVAVPSARQTTQSGSNLWDYARVYVRKGQRIQASFDEPVKAKGEGYLKPSIEALSGFLEKKEQLSGSLFGKIAEFTWGLDESFNIDELIAGVIEHIRN
jgi:CRISPR system Cascade subunit CasC